MCIDVACQLSWHFLAKNWDFQHWLCNKTVTSWLFGGIDKTTVPWYREQLDAPLPSALGNSASSCPWHFGAAVLTIPQAGMK